MVISTKLVVVSWIWKNIENKLWPQILSFFGGFPEQFTGNWSSNRCTILFNSMSQMSQNYVFFFLHVPTKIVHWSVLWMNFWLEGRGVAGFNPAHFEIHNSTCSSSQSARNGPEMTNPSRDQKNMEFSGKLHLRWDTQQIATLRKRLDGKKKDGWFISSGGRGWNWNW